MLNPCGTSAAAAAKSLQSSPNLCDSIDGSPPDCCPWDSPGKNTGVGCHFLLQCMKVKSESEVIQSCLILRNPMDCSLSGSSVQARAHLQWYISLRHILNKTRSKYTCMLKQNHVHWIFCSCYQNLCTYKLTWKSVEERFTCQQQRERWPEGISVVNNILISLLKKV